LPRLVEDGIGSNKTTSLATRIPGIVAMTLFAVLAATPTQAKFDIPTGAPPSPLFGAQPFTQQMLRLEEFGVRDLPSSECANCGLLPGLASCDGQPVATALDSFLRQRISPLPTRQANESMPNPWQSRIEQCVRPLAQTVIEGRPPGEFFAHQRWDEFPPEVYTQTASTGARNNGGLRDSEQLHGYGAGEFGPGGLYHNTTGTPGFNGTTAGIEVRFHPNMPLQDPLALWTFDGTFPPKLLMARYGFPILFRHYNALPIDPGANFGFGLHTFTTHEHNGHTPAESDGYTQAFFFPGEFFDYRWPMIVAGHDSINTGATDPRAGTPDGAGGIINIRGDWREIMSTHWFHDHMLDFTAQNVYKGSVAMMNYYSSLDRGNEGLNCHYENPSNVNLCLPSGTALDWGNRDYDVNLVVADKAWDADGQLFFNIFNLDGFLADRMTVNWLFKPYLEVRARRYRFRILNGSVSRYFKIALVDEAGQRVPFHMVANDGNLMEHSVPFPNAQSADLPTQGIAERYDIVIDFSHFQEGDKLYLVNILEHRNGKGPDGIVPLQDILSNQYCGGVPPEFAELNKCDPAVGKFMEFRVVKYEGQDLSMDPADYVEGKKKMIPLPRFSAEELANARHRTFKFAAGAATDGTPWVIKTDGGLGLGMDPHRLSAAPDEGSVEIWHLEGGEQSWSHPIHIHFEEGQILERFQPPPGGHRPPWLWEKWARKDVYRIGKIPDSGEGLVVALRFREFLGTYMEHCHNTQHEDHAMLLRWDIENPGQMIAMPTPEPTWEGVFYSDTFTLPTFKDGDSNADPVSICGAPEVCTLECGDGGLAPVTEECDDGNNLDGDGCSAICTLEPGPLCGDGNLEVGEECDDGNTVNGDACSSVCTNGPGLSCGDGHIDVGETCDDGNTANGDGSSAICTVEPDMLCGNGFHDPPEECDDGNNLAGDGCSVLCTIEAIIGVCGNGALDPAEACDDGNTANGDGCSDVCAFESLVIEMRVSASLDDAEENPQGGMVRRSSDLELIEGNLLVGMRFRGVGVPPGATILEARIQFQTDETGAGATSLTIEGEAVDNAGAFRSETGNISSRLRTAASASWNPAAWLSVNEAGPNQQTSDIRSVIQEIVDRPGWSSGNALAIIMTGAGLRTAESFDGDANGAPLLQIEYVVTSGPLPLPLPPSPGETVFETRVSGRSDDAEEDAQGGMVRRSSDLEMIEGNQWVGIRFADVRVPAGATVLEAYLQFQADETGTGATSVILQGEADNADRFRSETGNISSRPRTTAFAQWNPAPWTSVGEAGPAQKTPDLSSVIQEIVDGPFWSTGNALAIIITGSGLRTAESFDGDANGAPLLHVEYVTVTGPPPPPPTPTDTIIEVRVNRSADDAEEDDDDGNVFITSGDLEMVSTGDVQRTVGMRFRGLGIPQGATIVEAFLQFQVDETSTDAATLTFQGEAVSNASAFNGADGNVSARPRTAASTQWNPAPWPTVGAAGPDQMTPDLSAVIQEIVNRPGWSSGNALAIIVTGNGMRVAESFDGDANGAPLLHVRFQTP